MPFEPGESGNPQGRPPKGRALADVMAKYLDMPVGELRKLNRNLARVPAKDATAIRTILNGLTPKGVRDRQYAFDRVEGKPNVTIAAEITGDETPYAAMQRELIELLQAGEANAHDAEEA